MFLLPTINTILPNLGWQEAVTLIFLHISELWQRVFYKFVSFLVRMLTLYFLSIMESFIVHLLSLFSHPVNKGVYAHD
jgi:hypothetical protein